MNTGKSIRQLFAATFTIILGLGPAGAQTGSEPKESSNAPPDEEKWEFIAAPLYIWFAGVSGDASIGPVTAPLDIKFRDVFDNLEAIFTFHGEARKGKWRLFTDYMYLDLDPEVTGPAGGPIDIGFKNVVWEFGGTYLLRDESPSIEALGGLRYSNVSLSVTPVAARRIPGVSVREKWVDGFGGIRVSQRFGKNKRWRISGRADAGAGGSDLTWSSTLLLSWEYKDWLSFDAGYKWLSFDYETGSGASRFAYDVVYQGPIAGLEFHF